MGFGLGWVRPRALEAVPRLGGKGGRLPRAQGFAFPGAWGSKYLDKTNDYFSKLHQSEPGNLVDEIRVRIAAAAACVCAGAEPTAPLTIHLQKGMSQVVHRAKLKEHFDQGQH